jgi:hypothetical protein
MRDLDTVIAALAGSAFRSRMRLAAPDRAYLHTRGLPVVLAHARDFVDRRLAPASPRQDGRQTPMRGHPVFTAQHATATCCRGCLAKWHGIPAGRPLTEAERQHVVAAIGRWLEARAAECAAPPPRPGRTATTGQGNLFGPTRGPDDRDG